MLDVRGSSRSFALSQILEQETWIRFADRDEYHREQAMLLKIISNIFKEKLALV